MMCLIVACLQVSACMNQCLLQVVDLSQILWDSLLELDDLSASTTCIMDLLCTLLSHNPALFSTHQHQLQLLGGTPAGQPTMLTTLVPRLWPFLSHTITSVRLSCLKALLTLLHTGKYDVWYVQVFYMQQLAILD